MLIICVPENRPPLAPVNQNIDTNHPLIGRRDIALLSATNRLIYAIAAADSHCDIDPWVK